MAFVGMVRYHRGGFGDKQADARDETSEGVTRVSFDVAWKARDEE